MRHSADLATLTNPPRPPLFETRIEVPTGSSLHADYRVADFNGDGKLDMAVISLSGELRILLGNGTGFVVGQEAQVNGLPIWMTGADFDHDGDQDLVIVRNDANSTDIWINDGTGSFAKGQSIPVGADALAVTVGDWNGDDNPDVAVSRPQSPEIVIGFGDGAGGFAFIQQLPLPGGGRAFNIASGPVIGGGLDDLVVADPELSRLVVFPGATSYFGQAFLQLDVPNNPAAVAFGDLSGDGVPDLVVSTFGVHEYVVITEVFAKDGIGSVSYDAFHVPLSSRPSVATVADVTGDGRADIVGCLAFTASMVVAPQLPNGGVSPELAQQTQLDATGLPLRPFVGDLDGQGHIALFALSGGSDRINVWISTPGGELLGARNYSSTLPLASWLETADFDGDGDFEVATGSNDGNQVAIMGRDAEGRLVPEATVDVGQPVFQLKVCDLDGDGRTDLVVGVHGGLKVLRNTSSPGSYSFDVLPGSPVAIGSGDYPFGIAVADLDRDGDFDIAVCDFAGGAVHIVQGTSSPFTFAGETVIPVGGTPIDVVAEDFTGDGRFDLAVSVASAASIVVLRNDGTSFTALPPTPVGQTPNYLVSADFNRDGRADLVVSNAGSGSVSVLFATGTGFTVQDFAAGTAPTALLAQDLTGDGLADILVTSLISGDFRVLVGDGRGNFPFLPTFPGTLGASDATLQDMDGDGRPDLAITSLITNRVSLVKNITPQ